MLLLLILYVLIVLTQSVYTVPWKRPSSSPKQKEVEKSKLGMKRQFKPISVHNVKVVGYATKFVMKDSTWK